MHAWPDKVKLLGLLELKLDINYDRVCIMLAFLWRQVYGRESIPESIEIGSLLFGTITCFNFSFPADLVEP